MRTPEVTWGDCVIDCEINPDLSAASASKGALFALLIARAQSDYAQDTAPVTSDADNLSAISDALEMIEMNIEDGDNEQAKLINLAEATAACQRYAAVIMERMSATEKQRLAKEIFA